MIIYNTKQGILLEAKGKYILMQESWDEFINDDDLFTKLTKLVSTEQAIDGDLAERLLMESLLPPVGSQEIWAAGVTYYRSREARMEESKEAGGGDFYDRVYEADRPELFFKATPYRTTGSGQTVRIRNDSKWNVPEPELTLLITSSGKIVGYTCGNDMSSRDIEGENPLYLPQAKVYDNSASVGPGVCVTDKPLPSDTVIKMEIIRQGKNVFSGQTETGQIKRKFDELAGYLYREMTFPAGCFLMTGTGIVPPDSFSLQTGDEIRISITGTGTLTNYVE